MKHDLVHIQGKAYVLVPLHEYRGMTAAPVGQTDLPAEIMDRLFARSENPIKILRKFRGMTQAELAEVSGLSRPYLAEIETGRKDGSITALKNLALSLNAPLTLLIADNHLSE